MPEEKQYTLQEFGQFIKTKYPDYGNMDDSLLAEQVLSKYPDYQSIVKREKPQTQDGLPVVNESQLDIKEKPETGWGGIPIIKERREAARKEKAETENKLQTEVYPELDKISQYADEAIRDPHTQWLQNRKPMYYDQKAADKQAKINAALTKKLNPQADINPEEATAENFFNKEEGTPRNEMQEATLRLVDKSHELKDIYEKVKDQGDLKNLGSGIVKGATDYFKDYATIIDQLKDNKSIKGLNEKLQAINNGKDLDLTDDEIALLKALQVNTQLAENVSKVMPGSYEIGEMTGNSLGFMGEFILTAGVGSGVAKSIKAAGKGAKAAGRISANLAAKLAQSGIQVGAMPGFYKEAAKGIALTGKPGASLWDAYYDQFTETFSERIFIGAVGSAQSKNAVMNFLQRTGNAVANARGWKGVVKGMGEEILEEKFGELMQGAKQFDSFDKFWKSYLDVDRNLKMMASTSLITGVLGTANAAAYQKKKNEVHKNLLELSEKVPESIKGEIDNLINEKVSYENLFKTAKDLVKQEYDNGNLNDEQAKEVGVNTLRYVTTKVHENQLMDVEQTDEFIKKQKAKELIDERLKVDKNWETGPIQKQARKKTGQVRIGHVEDGSVVEISGINENGEIISYTPDGVLHKLKPEQITEATALSNEEFNSFLNTFNERQEQAREFERIQKEKQVKVDVENYLQDVVHANGKDVVKVLTNNDQVYYIKEGDIDNIDNLQIGDNLIGENEITKEKEFISPKDIKTIDHSDVNSLRQEMMFEVLGKIDEETEAREFAEKEQYLPGQEVTYEGKPAVVTEVENPTEGEGIKIRYINDQGVEQEEFLRPEQIEKINQPVQEDVQEETEQTPVLNIQGQELPVMETEQGYEVDQKFEESNDANKLAKALNSKYGNLNFEVVESIDPYDPFATYEYSIVGNLKNQVPQVTQKENNVSEADNTQAGIEIEETGENIPGEVQSDQPRVESETKPSEQAVSDLTQETSVGEKQQPEAEQQVQEEKQSVSTGKNTTNENQISGSKQDLVPKVGKEETNQKLRDLRKSILNDVKQRDDLSPNEKRKLAANIFYKKALEIDKNFKSTDEKEYTVSEFLTPGQSAKENMDEAVGETVANLKEERRELKDRGFNSGAYYMTDEQVKSALKAESEKQFAIDVVKTIMDDESGDALSRYKAVGTKERALNLYNNILDYENGVRELTDVNKKILNYFEEAYKSRKLVNENADIDFLEEDVALYRLTEAYPEIMEKMPDDLAKMVGRLNNIGEIRRLLDTEEILKLVNDVTERLEQINRQTGDQTREETSDQARTGRNTEKEEGKSEQKQKISKKEFKNRFLSDNAYLNQIYLPSVTDKKAAAKNLRDYQDGKKKLTAQAERLDIYLNESYENGAVELIPISAGGKSVKKSIPINEFLGTETKKPKSVKTKDGRFEIKEETQAGTTKEEVRSFLDKVEPYAFGDEKKVLEENKEKVPKGKLPEYRKIAAQLESEADEPLPFKIKEQLEQEIADKEEQLKEVVKAKNKKIAEFNDRKGLFGDTQFAGSLFGDNADFSEKNLDKIIEPENNQIARLKQEIETLKKNKEQKANEADSQGVLFKKKDQTKTEAFKNWFGKSKVVDENGEPLVVYHGGPNKINIFDEGWGGMTTADNEYGAFYFSDSEEVADDYSKESIKRTYQDNPEGLVQDGLITQEQYDKLEEEGVDWYEYVEEYADDNINVVDAYIRLENPLIIDAKYQNLRELEKQFNIQGTIGYIKGKGGETPEQIYDEIKYNSSDIENYREDIEKRAIENHDLESKEDIEDWMFDEATTEILEENYIEPEIPEYDGIIIKNVIDDIGYGSQQYQDVYIVVNPTDIKSASNNRGTFDPNNSDIRFKKKPFYSNTEKAIESIKQEKATPEQWKSMLLKNGSKEAELDWLGWDEFIQDKKSLTKNDLSKFVNSNKVEIQEVEKGNNITENDIDTFLDDEAGEGLSREEAREFLENDEKGEGYTKYFQYQLPGGENYKELLLTMPTKYNESRLQNLIQKKREGTITQQEEKEFNRLDNEVADSFQSTHFEEPNIVAHVRFNERTDAKGNRVLFIEEIQSDWAQEGRKKGFKILKPKYSIEEVNGKYKAKNNDTNEYFKNPKGGDLSAPTKQILLNIVGEQNFELTGIPNMPFKQTNQWLGLAFKRMVQYAAENGFDKIAWTTGEQQAERYDLSKQVDKIYAYRKTNGNYDIEALQEGVTALQQNDVSRNKLSEIVGKELAEKIVNNEGKNENPLEYEQAQSFSGQDLKVGGEGMKAFYDKILPNYANKFGKKFGAKVENTKIDVNPELTDEGIDLQSGEVEQDTKGKYETVQSIPITEKLANTAMEQGFPMFKNIQKPKRPQYVGEYVEYQNKKKAFEDAIKEATDNIEKELGIKVNVLKSFNNIPKNIKARLSKTDGMGIVGMYDPVSDQVFLFLDNIDDVNEAVRTVLHEVVGHKGLRSLLGEDYKNVLRNVFKSMKQEDIDRISKLYGTNNRLIIADEYLAEMSEQGKKPTFIQRAISEIRAILRRLFGIKFSDNDIHVLLQKSRENLKKQVKTSKFGTNENIQDTQKEKDSRDFPRRKQTNKSPQRSVRSRGEQRQPKLYRETKEKVLQLTKDLQTKEFDEELFNSHFDKIRRSKPLGDNVAQLAYELYNRMPEKGIQFKKKDVSESTKETVIENSKEWRKWRNLLNEIYNSEDGSYRIQYDNDGDWTDNENEFNEYPLDDKQYVIDKNKEGYEQYKQALRDLADELGAELNIPYGDSFYIEKGDKTISFRNHDVKPSTRAHHHEIYPILHNDGVSSFELDNAIEWINKQDDIRFKKKESEGEKFAGSIFDEKAALDKKEQKLREKIKTTPKLKETHYSHTLIKNKIRDLKQGWKLGKQDTKKNLVAIQKAIINYAKKNMPFDQAGKADVNKLLSLINKADNPTKLEDAYNKINEIVYGLNKGDYINKIDKLLKGNKPKKVNGKPKGTLDPDVYAALDKIRAIRKMTPDEFEKYYENIEEHDVETVVYATMFGNLEDKSPEQLADSYKKLIDIVDEGKVWFKEEMEAEKKRLKNLRYEVVGKITGGKGILPAQEYPGGVPIKKGNVDQFLNQNQSFEWILDKLSKDKTEETAQGMMQEYFGDLVHKSTNAEVKGINDMTELIHDKAAEIFGKDKKRLARVFAKNSVKDKNSGVTFRSKTGKRKELALSQNEAYKKWMEWQDPTLEATFKDMGWDETTKAELDEFMTPEIKKWAKWQLEEFYPMYHEGVNERFREAYFVNLPFNEKYSPIRREVTAVADKDDALLKGSSMLASVGSGSLKSRVANINHLQRLDGDQVLSSHISEMEHFKAWVHTMKELRSVFGSRGVQHVIKYEHGNGIRKILNQQINDFASAGRDRADVIDSIDKIRRAFVTAELGLNYTIFPKQLVSVLTYMSEMPVHNYLGGMMNLALNFRTAINTITESTTVKDRYKKGWTHEVRSALKSDNTKKLSGARSTLNDLRNLLMIPTKLGDFGGVLGGWSVYHYHYKKQKDLGKTDSEAHQYALNKFERAMSRSQQSARLADTSELQKGSWGKLFTMFKNSQQQYFRYESAAIRNLIKGRGSKLNNIKIIALYHVLLPVAFQAIANAFTDDDDEKEKKRLLRAGILGSFNGILIASDIIEYVLEKAMGEKWSYSATPLEGAVNNIGYGTYNISTGLKDMDREKIMKGVEQLGYGINNMSIGLPYRPTKKLIQKVKDAKEPERVRAEEAEDEFKKLKKKNRDWRSQAKKLKEKGDEEGMYNMLNNDKYIARQYTIKYINQDLKYIERDYEEGKISDKEYYRKKAAVIDKHMKKLQR